jgi:hypothetical protein
MGQLKKEHLLGKLDLLVLRILSGGETGRGGEQLVRAGLGPALAER